MVLVVLVVLGARGTGWRGMSARVGVEAGIV